MRSKKKCENVVTDVKKSKYLVLLFLNHELDDVRFIKYEHIAFFAMQFKYRIDVHLFLCPHPRVCLC